MGWRVNKNVTAFERGFIRVNPHPHKASIERDNESEDMQPSGRGYDHGITTFSPDGRLFQVEYARESVKRGTTTAGLKFREGVVLVCDKRIVSRLIIPESIEKMFKI